MVSASELEPGFGSGLMDAAHRVGDFITLRKLKILAGIAGGVVVLTGAVGCSSDVEAKAPSDGVVGAADIAEGESQVEGLNVESPGPTDVPVETPSATLNATSSETASPTQDEQSDTESPSQDEELASKLERLSNNSDVVYVVGCPDGETLTMSFNALRAGFLVNVACTNTDITSTENNIFATPILARIHPGDGGVPPGAQLAIGFSGIVPDSFGEMNPEATEPHYHRDGMSGDTGHYTLDEKSVCLVTPVGDIGSMRLDERNQVGGDIIAIGNIIYGDDDKDPLYCYPQS